MSEKTDTTYEQIVFEVMAWAQRRIRASSIFTSVRYQLAINDLHVGKLSRMSDVLIREIHELDLRRQNCEVGEEGQIVHIEPLTATEHAVVGAEIERLSEWAKYLVSKQSK